MAPKDKGVFIEESHLLKKYLKEIAQFPLLTAEEEKELGSRIQEGGDPDAVHTLVESNLRFVVAFAKKYRGWGLSFQDLINEGNIGLMEAAKRFDPEKGVRFITYAVWWIRQAIVHALSEQGGPFRIPQKQANLLHNIHKTVTAMTPLLERKPTAEEVAREMNLPREHIESLMHTQSEDIPLETLASGDTDFSLLDKIEQSSMPPLDQALVEESLRNLLEGMLQDLEPREREILSLRFGLDGGDPKTLKEVGEAVKLSRERVRQIETKVLNKLRQKAVKKQLMVHLN